MSQISLWMKRDGEKNEFENFFIIFQKEDEENEGW